MRACDDEVALTALMLLDAHGELTVDEGRRCSNRRRMIGYETELSPNLGDGKGEAAAA